MASSSGLKYIFQGVLYAAQRYTQYLGTLLPEAMADPCSQAFQTLYTLTHARVRKTALAAGTGSAAHDD